MEAVAERGLTTVRKKIITKLCKFASNEIYYINKPTAINITPKNQFGKTIDHYCHCYALGIFVAGLDLDCCSFLCLFSCRYRSCL